MRGLTSLVVNKKINMKTVILRKGQTLREGVKTQRGVATQREGGKKSAGGGKNSAGGGKKPTTTLCIEHVVNTHDPLICRFCSRVDAWFPFIQRATAVDLGGCGRCGAKCCDVNPSSPMRDHPSGDKSI